MSSTKRIESIDMTKGLLMIYVIILHATSFTMIGQVLIQCTFGGAMIAFLALSGYTYSSGNRTYIQNILRRIKQLLIPYIIYFVGIFVYVGLFAVWMGVEGSFTDALSRFWSVIMDKVNVTSFSADTPLDYNKLFYSFTAPMWFITGIITASFIFCAIARFADKSKMVCGGIIAGLLTASCLLKILFPVPVFFDIQDAPAFAAVMFTGLVLKNNKTLENRKLKGVWLVVCSLGLIIFNFLLLMLVGLPFGLSGGSWGKFGGYSVFSGYIVGILCLFMYVNICDALKSKKVIKNVFTYVGQNTLHILLIHCPIGVTLIYLAGMMQSKFNPTNQSMLITFGISIVVGVLSCLYVAGIKKISKK